MLWNVGFRRQSESRSVMWISCMVLHVRTTGLNKPGAEGGRALSSYRYPIAKFMRRTAKKQRVITNNRLAPKRSQFRLK